MPRENGALGEKGQQRTETQTRGSVVKTGQERKLRWFIWGNTGDKPQKGVSWEPMEKGMVSFYLQSDEAVRTNTSSFLKMAHPEKWW